MDIQYFCDKLSSVYSEWLNSPLVAEREQLKGLILFYIRCINDLINEEFNKPFMDL